MICFQGEEVWPQGDGYPNLYSIGVALGRMPRFCGHTRFWFPVLGHVLTVADILPIEAKLHGLLHDAPEACMGDVPTPWKTRAAKRREYMLLRRIYQGNGLEWPIPLKIMKLVKRADEAVLAAEAHVLGHPKATTFWPEPDEKVMEITSKYLDLAPNFLKAEISGPVFEEAYTYYLQGLNEFTDNKRVARNAARRERRANATRTTVG